MQFDKVIFLNNLEYYMREKNIKPRDIEEASGVSKGYISRLKKDGNKSVPGIDFILTASSMAGVSVETISTINMTQCTDNEKYIISFLDRLIGKTEKKTIKWKADSINDLRNKIGNKNTEQLILEHEPSVFSSFTGILSGSDNYKSSFEYEEYNYSNIIGDFYSVKIDDRNSIYLVKVNLHKEEDSFEGIEMFLVTKGNKKSNLCCADPQKGHNYDNLLYRLYNTIKESIDKNELDEEAKAVIDNFLTS